MKASELRERQRPLKDAYRGHPGSAVVPARAEATVDVAALTAAVRVPGGTRTAGLHEATGGTGDEVCSADLLLESLVACAGVTLAAVATAMSLDVRSVRIVANGRWDARGTLDRTERYCVVAQTLAAPPAVTFVPGSAVES